MFQIESFKNCKCNPVGAVSETQAGCILDCLVGEVEMDLTGNDVALHNEIQSYIKEPVRIADPLAWWKLNEARQVPCLLHYQCTFQLRLWQILLVLIRVRS